MNVTTLRTYSHVEHDALIEATEKELFPYAALEGKHHGRQNKPKTIDELYALIHNPIAAKIQPVIYITQEKFLPVSGMAVAHTIRKEADQQVQKAEGDKHELEHTLQGLEAKPKAYTHNTAKRRLRTWALIFTVIVGLADGFMCYDSFRYAGMGRVAACIAALGVTGAIIAAVHVMGGYIARAATRKSKLIRLSVTLCIALVSFYFINSLRAASVTEAALLQIDPEAAPVGSNTSPLAFTVISFALFAAAFLLAIRTTTTTEEQRAEQAYLAWQREVQKLKDEIAANEAEIESIRAEAIQKAADAVRIFEYASTCEQRLEAIAMLALNQYIAANLRHRTDNIVPLFFAHPPRFEFIKFFQNKNVQQ